MRLVPLVVTFVLALTEVFAASPSVEWARFRGPNGTGIADGNSPPVTFGPGQKQLWKTAVPPGHSSPIVWHDHIFITAVDGQELVTLALRRKDGTVRWRRVAPAAAIEPVHEFSYPAASTPVTDGTRVYAYFGSYGLIAYDFGGREIWRHPLPVPPSRYGTATSPIVFGGKVILQRDGTSSGSELLALDARTGSVLWRTPRPLMQDSWSTPVVWRHAEREEIITIGTNRVVAYGADGAERWWVGGLSIQPIHVAVAGTDLLYASMSALNAQSDPIDLPKWEALVRYDSNTDGRLTSDEFPKDAGIWLRREVPKETPGNFLPLTRVLGLADMNKDDAMTKEEWETLERSVRAREDKVLAIRPGGSGDATKAVVAWQATRGIPEIPSPLLYRDRVYFVRSGGLVTSYVAATGAIVLDRQRLGALGQYVASPVAADGRIYAANEPGTVVVFRAADTLDVLARNDLQESVTATPAIADSKLYIRTARHLWAFGD